MRSQGSRPADRGQRCSGCGVRRRPAGLWWGWCAECWSEKYRVLSRGFLAETLTRRAGAGGEDSVRVFVSGAVGLFRGALEAGEGRPVFRRACVEGTVRALLETHPLLYDLPSPEPGPEPGPVSGAGSGPGSGGVGEGLGWGQWWECVERLERWAVVFEQVADTAGDGLVAREAAGIAGHVRGRLTALLEGLSLPGTDTDSSGGAGAGS